MSDDLYEGIDAGLVELSAEGVKRTSFEEMTEGQRRLAVLLHNLDEGTAPGWSYTVNGKTFMAD